MPYRWTLGLGPGLPRLAGARRLSSSAGSARGAMGELLRGASQHSFRRCRKSDTGEGTAGAFRQEDSRDSFMEQREQDCSMVPGCGGGGACLQVLSTQSQSRQVPPGGAPSVGFLQRMALRTRPPSKMVTPRPQGKSLAQVSGGDSNSKLVIGKAVEGLVRIVNCPPNS